MKNRKARIRSSAMAAFTAAALPLAGFAQIERSQQETEQWERGEQQTQSSELSATSPDYSRMSSSQVSKIDESQLERKLTADELIGKKVVGNDGEKIGKVEDIDLGSALAGQDRSSARIGTTRSSSSDYSVSASTSNRSATTSRQESANVASSTRGANNAATRSGSASPSTSADTGAMTQARQEQRNYQNNQTAEAGVMSDPRQGRSYGLSGFAEEISIYVSSDDDQLLEVPASFLSYNEQEDRLELDMSQAEIEALPDQSYSSIN